MICMHLPSVTCPNCAPKTAPSNVWPPSSPTTSTFGPPSRCGCGRRLRVLFVCVRCDKEQRDCKCDDLTAGEAS